VQYIVNAVVDHPRSKGPRALNEYVEATSPEKAQQIARLEFEEDGYTVLRVNDVKPRRVREKLDPSLIPRQGRIIGAARRHIPRGVSIARRGIGAIRRGRGTRRVARPVKPATKPTVHRYIADPGHLTKPDDHPGYDNLNLVRLVEADSTPGYVPTKQLIEGQIVMPPHQFDTLMKKMSKWGDVEIVHEPGGPPGPNRIIRRGRENQATNIFIDKA
jgi:hypothetical protein